MGDDTLFILLVCAYAALVVIGIRLIWKQRERDYGEQRVGELTEPYLRQRKATPDDNVYEPKFRRMTEKQ